MEIIIASVAVITALAGLFGFGLAYAGKKLAVEKDQRINDVEDVLPGVNCGACGYPGCSGYAEAVVVEDVDISLCAPGGRDVASRIGSILGKIAASKTLTVARIHCGGDDSVSNHRYKYNGIYDCASAAALFGGFLECTAGCLGMGSCVKVCKFDAIEIDDNGKTTINAEHCTGCGACLRTCPHHLIELLPASKAVYVACSSNEKGGVCNKFCEVSCIGCMRCVKECPYDAIHVENSLAYIDYEKCTSCGKCVSVCPKKCIIQDGQAEEQQPGPAQKEPEIAGANS